MRHSIFQLFSTIAKPIKLLLIIGLLAPSLVVAASIDTARDLLNQGQYDEAALEANRYISEHPGDTQARFVRGLALARSGRSDSAITLFRELSDEYPDLAEPLNNLGVLYAQKGDFLQASDALEKAAKINPEHGPAQENLGDVYVALARDAFEKAAALEQNNSAVRQKRARLQALLDAPRDEVYVDDGQIAPGNTSKTLADSSPSPRAVQSRPQPVATPRSTPAPTNTDADISVTTAAKRWAQAWSDQNVGAYLNAYSADFTPDSGQSRSRWASERSDRVASPGLIEVDLSNFDVQIVDDSRSIVSFTQRYRSDNYRDQERKALLMRKEGAGWKILREGSLNGVESYAGVGQRSAPVRPEILAPTDTAPDGRSLNNGSDNDRDDGPGALVSAWAKEWSDQNLDGYFAVYSNQFDPEGGQSLEAWIRERQDRVSSPNSISVRISNLRIETTGSDTANAKFLQRYESGNYNDRTAKTLRLRREAEGWRIVREISN